jgi:RNA polymerase sigma-70 factor, ECF subfamily
MRRVIDTVDGDTVRAVGHGDREALAILIDEFAPHVLGMMRQLIDDSSQSSAMTRAVFLEVWRTAPRYNETMGQPLAWVMTIALRRAFDWLRFRVSAPPDYAGGMGMVTQSGDYAVEMGRVEQALAALTDVQRQVISMSYFEFLSIDEIANALNLPTSTVKTRTRDAVLTLRLLMFDGERAK